MSDKIRDVVNAARCLVDSWLDAPFTNNISGDHVCLSAGYWKELNYIEIERLKKALEALDE